VNSANRKNGIVIIKRTVHVVIKTEIFCLKELLA